MKKLLMIVALVAAVAAGYMVTGSNESELNMSDLAFANVVALADENPCPNGCLIDPDIYCKCNGIQWGFMEKNWEGGNPID